MLLYLYPHIMKSVHYVNISHCVQVLFACAEALYAHGYSNEACRLAVELARDLLANPPDLKVEQPQTKVPHFLAILSSFHFKFVISTSNMCIKTTKRVKHTMICHINTLMGNIRVLQSYI